MYCGLILTMAFWAFPPPLFPQPRRDHIRPLLVFLAPFLRQLRILNGQRSLLSCMVVESLYFPMVFYMVRLYMNACDEYQKILDDTVQMAVLFGKGIGDRIAVHLNPFILLRPLLHPNHTVSLFSQIFVFPRFTGSGLGSLMMMVSIDFQCKRAGRQRRRLYFNIDDIPPRLHLAGAKHLVSVQIVIYGPGRIRNVKMPRTNRASSKQLCAVRDTVRPGMRRIKSAAPKYLFLAGRRNHPRG